MQCGNYTVREIPETNLFIFMLTDTCDAGWRDCQPCTVENCREAIAKDKGRQLCMPCNCHLFHDTCSLTYTAGGGIASTGDQNACPSAPPSYHTHTNNVCGVCVCENGVPKSGAACVADGASMCLACDKGYTMDDKQTKCIKVSTAAPGYVWCYAHKFRLTSPRVPNKN